MQIRHAQETDLPTIVEIFNSSIPGRMATAIIEPVTVEQRREWFRLHAPDRSPIWVIEKDNEVAGWLSLTTFFPERPAYGHTVEMSVYVAPKSQGQGLGKRLIEFALEKAPQLGIKNVVSLIFGHNEVSLRMHEKLGFARWGLLPGVAELDAVPRDVVILGLRVA